MARGREPGAGERPSVVLAGSGVVALLVSLGVLTGLGPALVSALSSASLDGRWVLVALACAVGLALVLVPGRRGR